MKKNNVSVREYEGTYFIEYVSKSLGMTLCTAQTEKAALNEYNRLSKMTNRQVLKEFRSA